MNRLLPAILLCAIVSSGVFHVLALLPDGDSEGSYLYHGELIVRGQLKQFSDSLTGHRTPLASSIREAWAIPVYE